MTDPDMDRELIPAAAGVEDGTRAGPQLEPGDTPERVLLAWGRPLFERAVRYTRAEDLGKRVGDAPLHVGKWAGKPVGILEPGPGAAATAAAVEALGAAGAKVLVGVGYATSLDPLLASRTLLAVKEADPGDGTSARYHEDAGPVPGFENVTDALEASCGQESFPVRCGRAWSTAARHRATVGDVKAWRAAGALAMDEESATLLAVAHRRGFRAGSLLVVADELAQFKPVDAPVADGEDPLAYAWSPAPAGTLDRITGAVVRAAFTALLGELVAMDEDEAPPA